jgi:hypothetical protein
MSAVALGIGIAVSKWVIRLWANDTPTGSFAGEMLEMIPAAIDDTRQRRVAARQFDRLAEEVADRILPFLSTEISGSDEGELTAAAEGARRALTSSLLSMKTMLEADLDSEQLATDILELDQPVVASQLLSEAGSAAYELVVRESVSYAVAVAVRLPAFDLAVHSELLSRESTLIDLATKVLAAQPEPTVPDTWGRGSAHQRFETRYRRSVFEYADRLQLFGVTSPTAKSAYSLSVAYIPLQMTESTRGKDAKASNTTFVDGEAVRIETALRNTSRILITGGAGIGKTTLIQWLTLCAARDSFKGELEDWNGNVPFVIQLRRFVGVPFPPPESFLSLTTPAIAGAMPSGWVHKILEDGRALLLIDGFDEVSADRRSEALTWLRELSSAFPENKFVVTSRDNAVTESWQDEFAYTRVSLLPMEYGDIRQFIAHWHEAALGTAPTPARVHALRISEKAVLAEIRDKASIRSLCTSPLLCALICALNFEGGARLPENRIEVYDAALQMLVVRRDRDRRVEIMPDLELTYTESELLLRGFAYWVHDNRASDASRADYEFNLSDQLERLHHVDASASTLAAHLLARSGVLREPVIGRVDFVHRTFLEYLAAKAVIAANQIGKLIALSDEDHWREVIILAAGLAPLEGRERLIRGLIARGEAEPARRHTFYLLALSCMETSPELTRELQDRLADCLREVIPPGNMTDAAAIAASGELAVPLLSNPPTHAIPAAASVRALALIGGDSALAALKSYRADPRLTVARQLVRSWGYFDPEIYVREVLSHSPLERGSIWVSDVEQIRLLPELTKLEKAVVTVPRQVGGLDIVPRLEAITSIVANDLTHMESLGDLDGLIRVESLSVMDAINLRSLEGIESLTGLRSLDMDGCHLISDLAPLTQLQHLEYLDGASTAISDLESLESGATLESLRVDNCSELSSLGHALAARNLQISSVPKLRSAEGISNSAQLESLQFVGRLGDVTLLELPSQLRSLRVIGMDARMALSGAKSLERLTVDLHSGGYDWVKFCLERSSILELALTCHSGFPLETLASLFNLPNLRLARVHSLDSEASRLFPEYDGFERRMRGRILTYERLGSPR